MQVDVSHILSQGEGSQADFVIEGEQPQLDHIELAAPLQGNLRIIGTKTGILVAGRFSAEVILECSRCLQSFMQHVEFPVNAEFEDDPAEDQFPIDKHGKIDLAEAVRQEIEVHLPLQRLCQDDCPGIELNQAKDT